MMTVNGKVQTREEVTENVKELDLFVTVILLEEARAVLSFGKLCEDIMGILTTGPAVKNHISPKMARELIATHQTVCHSSSLVYRRVKQIHRKSSTRMKWKYE